MNKEATLRSSHAEVSDRQTRGELMLQPECDGVHH